MSQNILIFVKKIGFDQIIRFHLLTKLKCYSSLNNKKSKIVSMCHFEED